MAACSSGSTSHGICTIGSEGCACTSGGGCDGLLTCLSSVCVDNRADAGPPSKKPDAAGWDVGPIDSNPPPPGCVTDTYCAPNGGATPCPSGYDCNAGLTPPRCVRLYCGTAGTACSEDVQCELGLICDRACTNDLTDRFVGSWTWTSGIGQWVCNGMIVPIDKPNDTLIIVRGGIVSLEVHS